MLEKADPVNEFIIKADPFCLNGLSTRDMCAALRAIDQDYLFLLGLFLFL